MKLKKLNTGVYRTILCICGLFAFAAILLQCASVKKMTQTAELDAFILKQKTFSLQNKHQIKYIDTGISNDVILLVHGVPTSSWMYRNLISKLVEKGYRVIAPDLLGYGQSDKPDGYDIYSPTAMAGYLNELMNSLKVAQWTQLCHDAGSLWTLEMYNTFGADKRITHLVMLNSIILKSGFNPPIKLQEGNKAKLYIKSYCVDGIKQNTISMTIKNGLFNPALCTKEMLAGYIAPTQGRLDYALYHFFTHTCDKDLTDYSETLKQISSKKTIIWGAEDKILSWEKQAEELTSLMQLNPENIFILPDAKHYLAEENADFIAESIGKTHHQNVTPTKGY